VAEFEGALTANRRETGHAWLIKGTG